MQTVFDLRNVSYTYLGKFPALKDVTLTINEGENVAIMGANGSGKSTLLSILNGLVYPTEGEFYAFGNPVTEDVFDNLENNEVSRYFRKKVGFVFQNPDVQLFCSTVFDEVAFGPLQLDLSKDEVNKAHRRSHGNGGHLRAPGPLASYAQRRREEKGLPGLRAYPSTRTCCSWTSRRPAWTRGASSG